MSRPWWRVTLLAVVAVASIVLVGPGRADAEQPSGLSNLRSCLQQHVHPVLNVLMVLDTSGSISQTDPNNRRLTGAEVALSQLGRLADPDQAGQPAIQVNVQRAVFSSGFTPLNSWQRVGSDPQSASVADLGAVRLGGNTDYVAALDGARKLLAARAAQDPPDNPSCQMLIWFTDGRYEPVDIHSRRFQGEVAAGTAELCRVGGTMDQLRANGVNVITVGLTTEMAATDEGFLRRLSGVDPGCGRVDGDNPGTYLRADNQAQLVEAFYRLGIFAEKPSEACTPVADGCTFDLEPGLHKFAVLIEPGSADAVVTLKPPDSPEVTLSRTAGGSSKQQAGAQLDWEWHESVVVVRGTLSRTDAAWVGRWTVGFGVSGADRGNGSVFLYGDEAPTVSGPLTFRRGTPWTFTVHAQNADGGLPALPGSAPVPALTVTVVSPADDDRPRPAAVTVRPGGDWTVSFSAPLDWSGSQVAVHVTLAVRTSSGIDISPPELVLTASVVSSILVSPDPLRFPAITGAATTRADLSVTGVDKSQCVWIAGGGVDLTTAPQVDPARIRATGAGSDQAHCLTIPVHGSRLLSLTASFAGGRGWEGTGLGSLTVMSVDETGKIEKTDLRTTVHMAPGLIARPPVYWAFAGMLVLSLLPLLIFWFVNVRLLPRFDKRDRLAARYTLRASWREDEQRLELADGGRPWRPSPDDFRIIRHGPRSFTVGKISFSMRVPRRRPFSTPVPTFGARPRRPVGTQRIGDRALDLVAVAGPAGGLPPDGADVDVVVVLDAGYAVTPTVVSAIRDQAEKAVSNLPRQRTEI